MARPFGQPQRDFLRLERFVDILRAQSTSLLCSLHKLSETPLAVLAEPAEIHAADESRHAEMGRKVRQMNVLATLRPHSVALVVTPLQRTLSERSALSRVPLRMACWCSTMNPRQLTSDLASLWRFSYSFCSSAANRKSWALDGRVGYNFSAIHNAPARRSGLRMREGEDVEYLADPICCY